MVVMPRRFCTARDLDAQLLAHLGVERGQRLVEQQRGRIGCQRTGERDALLLAAGHLRGQLLGLVGEMHEIEHLLDSILHSRLVPAATFEPVADVAGGRHVGKQRVGLEDDAEIAIARGDRGQVGLAEANAAAIGLLKPGDDPQQGGLAAARGPEEADEGALGHLQRDMVERGQLAEALDEIVDRKVHGAFPAGVFFQRKAAAGARPPGGGAGGIGSRGGARPAVLRDAQDRRKPSRVSAQAVLNARIFPARSGRSGRGPRRLP